MEKWKFFTLSGLELPLPLVAQPVASRYTDWAIPATLPQYQFYYGSEMVFWTGCMCIECMFQGSVSLRVLTSFLISVKLFPKFRFLVRLAVTSSRTEQRFSLSELSLLLMSHSWYELFSVFAVTVSASSEKEVSRCRYVKGDWVAEMWEFHSRWRSNYRGSVIEVQAVEVVVNFRVKNSAFFGLL
jgi:hypothetical protein